MFVASRIVNRSLVMASLLVVIALYVACGDSTDVNGSVGGFPDAGSCVFSGSGDPSGGACVTGNTCEFTLTSSNPCDEGNGPCTCPNGSWQCTISHNSAPACQDSGTSADANASDAPHD